MKKVFTLSLLMFIFLNPWYALAQNWTKIRCGGEFSIGIKSDGSLWAWGLNSSGQLGIVGTKNQAYPNRVGNDKDWKDISAGGMHVLALKNDGSLWAWGNGTYGQVGQGSGTYVNDEPLQVGSDTDWVFISAGYASSYAIKRSGKLYAWGFNFFGELGDSSTDNAFYPRAINSRFKFSSVAAGSIHAAALAANGTIWAWGFGSAGQLGQGTIKNSLYPIKVGGDSDWASLASGAQFLIARKKNGTIWSWGDNSKGQLGIGNTNIALEPTQIKTDSNFRFITCAADFAFGIKSDNTLYAWGNNNHGQLGVDPKFEPASPLKADSSTDWITISGATGTIHDQTKLTLLGSHAIGLKTSYNGYCGTGTNDSFQIGTEDTSQISRFDCTLGLKTAVKSQVITGPELNIFPNPTTGLFSLAIKNNNKPSVMYIRSVTGQVVYCGRIEKDGLAEYDLSGFAKGIYAVQIISGTDSYIKKVIVE